VIVNTSVQGLPETEADAKPHVAGSVAPVGPETEQVRPTAAVKRFPGAMVMVDVLPEVAPGVRLRVLGLADKVKLAEPAAVTVAVTTVVCVMEPEIPVTVTGYAPAVVVEVVVTVSTSVQGLPETEADARPQVAGLVAPVGPETEQVRPTAPVKPFTGATVIVDVLLEVAPGVRLNVTGLAERVKLGEPTAVTVAVTTVVCVMEPAIPVTVTA